MMVAKIVAEHAYSRQRKFAPLGVMLFVAAEIINNRAVGRGAFEVVEVLILEDSAKIPRATVGFKIGIIYGKT